MQADFKAKEDAESVSKIDPKHALITLVMIILAILLGDSAFVTALYRGYALPTCRPKSEFVIL